MKIHELNFDYPDSLIALKPSKPSRVMWVEDSLPREISVVELLESIKPQDVLVVNLTKVIKRRVYTKLANEKELEILFLKQISDLEWEVLFPSKEYKIGAVIDLPLDQKMTLIKKGRPQIVRLQRAFSESDFEKIAEIPLPPYIQKVRGERHTLAQDQDWYQTAWAQKPGSLAAPTASLHFSKSDIEILRSRGVKVVELVLHVGLGTFLPVTADDLNDHDMHEEFVEIPMSTWEQIDETRKTGSHIWAMGTTVARALESAAGGLLAKNHLGFSGFTKLLIQPGYQWKVVDRLLTNFHQPQSTLLALVAGFANLKTVKECYKWAIERKFRLFSYGDLSVWMRSKE